MAASPRRSATRSASSSSTCCASTPARSASASSCRCSTSPSRRVSHHLKVLREAGIVGLRAPRPVGLLLRPPRRPEGAVRMAELTEDPRDRPRALRSRGSGRRRNQAGGCCGGTGVSAARPTRRASSAARSTTRPAAKPCRRPPSSASLGCGVPTAVADLHEGETVLDLGSGAGADVLISARRVGPDRQGDRARHDRRDARARARQRGRGRRRRTPSSSRATSRRCRSPTRASTS